MRGDNSKFIRTKEIRQKEVAQDVYKDFYENYSEMFLPTRTARLSLFKRIHSANRTIVPQKDMMKFKVKCNEFFIKKTTCPFNYLKNYGTMLNVFYACPKLGYLEFDMLTKHENDNYTLINIITEKELLYETLLSGKRIFNFNFSTPYNIAAGKLAVLKRLIQHHNPTYNFQCFVIVLANDEYADRLFKYGRIHTLGIDKAEEYFKDIPYEEIFVNLKNYSNRRIVEKVFSSST